MVDNKNKAEAVVGWSTGLPPRLHICIIGSAVPQNRIPVAIVVHILMANHFHLVNMGIALSPPMWSRPNGLK